MTHLNEALADEKKILETELDQIYDLKVKGAQIRSRAHWIENGEKSTKYFYGLENKSQADNTIYELNIKGDLITDDSQILENLRNFYEVLYTSKKMILKPLTIIQKIYIYLIFYLKKRN